MSAAQQPPETEPQSCGPGPVAAEQHVGAAGGHPTWCSAQECHVSLGTRVHRQAPVRWEDTAARVSVESRLLDPADDPHVYVELTLTELRFGDQFHNCLPLEVAQRLRDQLTAQLNAAR